jgi:signal peptidase I
MRHGKYEKIERKKDNGAATKQSQSFTDTVYEYLHDVLGLLVIVILVLVFFLRVVIVSGSSMKNTLVDGDYVLLLSNYAYRNPQQGDIVVASKDSFRGGEPIIKRVIALEGQSVDIDFDSGTVYVDGEALVETYIGSPTHTPEGVQFPMVVAEGCVFVLGDNRMDSIDSRSPSIGMIDCREILGKAVFLLLPGDDKGDSPRDFSRIGGLA